MENDGWGQHTRVVLLLSGVVEHLGVLFAGLHGRGAGGVGVLGHDVGV